MPGCGLTFWESTGTFGPSSLQRWWGVKGGHCAPSGAGHGVSRVWSFWFESLFSGAVHGRGGVYWSLHTLVWHLEGQQSQGENLGMEGKSHPSQGDTHCRPGDLSHSLSIAPS